MSDLDSTAATQGTSFSPMPSSYASPENSQNAPTFHPRSPSPEDRSSKRRRFNTYFPENQDDLNHDTHVRISSPPPSRFIASQSLPNLPSFVGSNDDLEPQPRTFLGYDREYMSHILSSRGVLPRAKSIMQTFTHIPGLRSLLERLPVAAADNSHFIGWRHKADTWPFENGRYIRRSFTTPH